MYMGQVNGKGGATMKDNREDKLARRLNGGLLGYAFVVSLALHLVVWGLLSLPRDDAGVSWEKGTLARTARVETHGPLWAVVLAGGENKGCKVSLDPDRGLQPDPGDGVARLAPVGETRLDVGSSLVGPPDNTKNYAVRYTRPPAAVAIERPPLCHFASALWVRPAPTVYVDEGGRVRNGARLEHDALLVKTRPEVAAVKARAGGREGEAVPAAVVRLYLDPLSRSAFGPACIAFLGKGRLK
jgi:hypothetical protein